MRKLLKIILAIFAVLIIIVAIVGAIFFLDLVAYTATGSQTLPASGTPMGTALVLYDPGLTGAATRVAEKVAAELQNQSLTVILAGIKSSAAANTTGYDVIVIGGPIYAGTPTASVKDALNALVLNHDQDTRIGVFGSGQGPTSQEDVAQIKGALPSSADTAMQNAVVVKIGETEDLDARVSDFVNQLVM